MNLPPVDLLQLWHVHIGLVLDIQTGVADVAQQFMTTINAPAKFIKMEIIFILVPIYHIHVLLGTLQFLDNFYPGGIFSTWDFYFFSFYQFPHQINTQKGGILWLI